MSETHSVMSDSLWPHGLYSPWNSLGQNTGVYSLSLLQGIFPTRDWTQVSCIAGRFFTRWATRGGVGGACSNIHLNAGVLTAHSTQEHLNVWSGYHTLVEQLRTLYKVVAGHRMLEKLSLGKKKKRLGDKWLPRWLSGKESTCQCKRCRFEPWFAKFPWRRK